MFFQKDRCTIYEHRPMTCRVYPFNIELDEEGRRMVGMDINDAVDCPYQLDGKNSKKEVLRVNLKEDEQDGEYWALVEEWNEHFEGETQKEFLKFIEVIDEDA